MITCGSDGRVIVNMDGSSFDLSVSDQYADLVLLLTSPDERVQVVESDFEVDEMLDGDNKAKAERYSAFICSFLKKRKEKLNEDLAITAEKREASINELIDYLAQEGE